MIECVECKKKGRLSVPALYRVRFVSEENSKHVAKEEYVCQDHWIRISEKYGSTATLLERL